MISNALDSVQTAQQSADGLATQASTGGLADVQDYLIAATQASVDTQITAAVRDKAIQAFQSIMGMPV
jgi:flagellar hook-basal body complex protein FliE